MLLSFPDGAFFATGATQYRYGPADDDLSLRIILWIEIEGIPTEAILDTGAPYTICSPSLVPSLPLDAETRLVQAAIRMRGYLISGHIHRLTVTFPAQQGEPLSVDASVLVPTAEAESAWGQLPSFLGLMGCLDRMRLAVDPAIEIFYFGPPW